MLSFVLLDTTCEVHHRTWQPLSGGTGRLQLKHTPLRLVEFSGLVLGLCFLGNLIAVCSVNVLIVSVYLPPPVCLFGCSISAGPDGVFY